MEIGVLSGAGMSAESGIPTFRDALTGLWARFDAGRLATREAFDADPALVWGWYRWRAAAVLRAEPNAGHRGLALLEALGHRVTVVTQNVDNLHERAGSSRVLHLHGSLFASRCANCGAAPPAEPMRARPEAIPAEGAREQPLLCAECGGRLRPGVVWFGENLPEAPWHAARSAIAGCELLVVIGTSALVQPAAALPLAALEAGTPVLEINPQATALSAHADASWRMPAGTGVQRLLDRLASCPGAAPRQLLQPA